MLAIVGKANPYPETGAIEYYLRDFESLLARTGKFAYAWTFNPDDAAISVLSNSITGAEPVFLYLPEKAGYSSLRMHLADLHHDRRPQGIKCPEHWQQWCIPQLQNRCSFGPMRHQAIHLWLLVDAIEQLSPPVYLHTEFVPVFDSKYAKWGQSYFSFLRPHAV